jgi:hypothetical protein
MKNPENGEEVLRRINYLTTPADAKEKAVIDAASSFAALISDEDFKAMRPDIRQRARNIYNAMGELWERNRSIAQLAWSRFEEQKKVASASSGDSAVTEESSTSSLS